MASLSIRGKLVFPPGIWGLTKPVAGASITLTDLDIPGRNNDIIWQGTSDHNGNYQGTTSEWRDTITVTPATPFTPAITVPDATDVMLLNITVTQNTPQGQKSITLPYTYLGSNIPSPPIMVNWAPPDPVIVVNGSACYTGQDVQGRISSAANSGQKITIQVYGPESALLQPLTLPQQQLRNWIKQRYNNNVNGFLDGIPFPTPPDWAVGVFLILIGVAIICLVAGASILLVCLGLGVLYAISKGYGHLKVSQKTNAQGENYIEFEIEK